MAWPVRLALLQTTIISLSGSTERARASGSASFGTLAAALDSRLGAEAGHIISLRATSTARWDRYAADGLLSNAPRLVQRLPGIVGADVPTETISLRVRAELAHGREVHEGVGTLGALGCYASHLKAWRAVVASGVSRALIFEEDAVLTIEGVEQLGAMGSLLADFVDTAGTGSTLRDGFDVALLGYIQLRSGVDESGVRENQQQKGGWVRLRGAFWGTHAYLVTRRGAAKLIAQVCRLLILGRSSSLGVGLARRLPVPVRWAGCSCRQRT